MPTNIPAKIASLSGFTPNITIPGYNIVWQVVENILDFDFIVAQMFSITSHMVMSIVSDAYNIDISLWDESSWNEYFHFIESDL